MRSHKTPFVLAALLALGLAACGRPEPDADLSNDPAPTPPAAVSPANSEGADPTAEAARPAELDMTVVPGERVGPITATTSREELAEIFGEEALTDEDVAMGEGEVAAGTVVNLGEDRRLAVVWLDDARTEPLLVKDFGRAWTTPQGLGLGCNKTDLAAALGEYQLYGFGWDYAGTVMLENTQLDKYAGDLILRVRPTEAAIEARPEAYQALQGDTLFESDDPNLAQLEFTVYEMMVYLNAAGE